MGRAVERERRVGGKGRQAPSGSRRGRGVGGGEGERRRTTANEKRRRADEREGSLTT